MARINLCQRYDVGIFPQYFSKIKTIGNIVETTPNAAPIEMAYLYNNKDQVLKLEVFTDCVMGKDDKSEVDLYDVIFDNGDSPDATIIKLSIETQGSYPTPYLRYTLQKIE